MLLCLLGFKGAPTAKVIIRHGMLLEQVDEERDLWIFIDAKLIFGRQVAKAVLNVNLALGVIRHTFESFDRQTLPYLRCPISIYLKFKFKR